MTTKLPKTKQEAARRLAGFHYKVEGGLVKVFQVTTPAGDDDKTIVLLEVNKDTIATGIVPLGFAAAPGRGIPFSSVIVEVTPDEFKKIVASKLSLPHGWKLGEEISKGDAILAMK